MYIHVYPKVIVCTQVKELSVVASEATRSIGALAVSLGPDNAEALRELGAQLQLSIQTEVARTAASHSDQLRAVSDALLVRLDALPGNELGAELADIVKEIRYIRYTLHATPHLPNSAARFYCSLVYREDGASNESFSQCALQLLHDLSTRVQVMAEELCAVRTRLDALPAQLSDTMGAMLAAQHEGLLKKMTEIADASTVQLRQVDKATNAAKLGTVINSFKTELQDWLTAMISASADAAALKATAGVQEASLAQQTALFQHLAALDAMEARLQKSTRSDLAEMKAELSGLITNVNDNVCAVRDKLEAVEAAFQRVQDAVDALRADSVHNMSTLDGIVALMQDCAPTATVAELLAGYAIYVYDRFDAIAHSFIDYVNCTDSDSKRNLLLCTQTLRKAWCRLSLIW